jgi:hypothetical protein
MLPIRLTTRNERNMRDTEYAIPGRDACDPHHPSYRSRTSCKRNDKSASRLLLVVFAPSVGAHFVPPRRLQSRPANPTILSHARRNGQGSVSEKRVRPAHRVAARAGGSSPWRWHQATGEADEAGSRLGRRNPSRGRRRGCRPGLSRCLPVVQQQVTELSGRRRRQTRLHVLQIRPRLEA